MRACGCNNGGAGGNMRAENAGLPNLTHYEIHLINAQDGYAYNKVKVKAFPFSKPSVGPGADPSVQAVSPQVTVSHPPGGRLPLLSARPAVISPDTEHHCPSAGTKLYCLVTEAHRCEQLAQGCYAALPRVGFEPATY